MYVSVVAALVAVIRMSGRRVPRRIPPSDVALLGVATFKLSRLLTRERVTSFIRAPFTEFERPGKGPEVLERPVGSGVRHAVGELLTCPFCAAQWIGTALAAAYVLAPGATRIASVALTAISVADASQYAHTAVQEQESPS